MLSQLLTVDCLCHRPADLAARRRAVTPVAEGRLVTYGRPDSWADNHRQSDFA